MSVLQDAVLVVLVGLLIWREGSDQPYLVKLAMAYSLIQRTIDKGWWGHDILSVIAQPWQYTSMTGVGDPNLIRWPRSEDASWADSLAAANAALHATEANPAPTADSYYSLPIEHVPKWATPSKFLTQIGTVRFYRVGVHG